MTTQRKRDGQRGRTRRPAPPNGRRRVDATLDPAPGIAHLDLAGQRLHPDGSVELFYRRPDA